MQTKPTSTEGGATDGLSAVKYVTKSDGRQQAFDLEKIRRRLISQSKDLANEYINYDVIMSKVQSGIYSGKSTQFQLTSYYHRHYH